MAEAPAYWSWWWGSAALAGVVVLHWLWLHRLMAVSGSFSAVVNRIRHPSPSVGSDEPLPQELRAALRAATERLVKDTGRDAELPPAPKSNIAPSQQLAALGAGKGSVMQHVSLLMGLCLGGLVATLCWTEFEVAWRLRGQLAETLLGESPAFTASLLFLGGLLVGFGTRMASGCTSGHGLCGVSRLQPGSLLATLAFFATGAAASLLLRALS